VIKLGVVYLLAGLMFGAFAILSATDRNNPKRFGNAAFWGLVSASFLAGDRLGDLGNGVLVLGLAGIAGFGLLGRGAPDTTTPQERRELSERFGEKLFIPALTLPLVVIFGVLVLKPLQVGGGPLLDPKQATLISLALAALIAVAVAIILLRQPLISPLQEGRRLMDTVGWAALLPQMLAALGAVFALAGVGKVIGDLVTTWIPMDTRGAAVAVYCLGMAGFTMIMGNAFAAFPVLTAGVALPVLIGHFAGKPRRGLRHRHALRVLRDADDAACRQLQPGAAGPPRTPRPLLRDQGPDPDRHPVAPRQHGPDVCPRVPIAA
jgi:uncharacterized membrane protein